MYEGKYYSVEVKRESIINYRVFAFSELGARVSALTQAHEDHGGREDFYTASSVEVDKNQDAL